VSAVTLTVIGRDHPGLVAALAERVAAAGGNWLESRMARLAGQFAGILLVEAPEEGVERLLAALRALDAEGLRVTAERGQGDGPPPAAARPLTLELVGHDRPGIVRSIAGTLAAHGVNIEELETAVATGSFSGESLFRARARLQVPAALAAETLQAALEAIGHELMVDVTLEPGPG
jgi:glycine cleavage system regulatory protein